jgi:hypothetical protein
MKGPVDNVRIPSEGTVLSKATGKAPKKRENTKAVLFVKRPKGKNPSRPLSKGANKEIPSRTKGGYCKKYLKFIPTLSFAGPVGTQANVSQADSGSRHLAATQPTTGKELS